MNSALVDFLQKDYPSHYKIPRNPERIQVRKEQWTKGRFEIRDGRLKIVQNVGEGVSVINNLSNKTIEIIDFESYINQFAGTNAGKGRKCDFIINAIDGTDFIIFNELTESKSRYIQPFTSPETGELKMGKLAYAKEQLEMSIEKFYSVNNFLDNYSRKVALFSYRLTDGKPDHSMTKSINAFRKPQKALSNIRSKELLAHNFIFEQRMYNMEYKVI